MMQAKADLRHQPALLGGEDRVKPGIDAIEIHDLSHMLQDNTEKGRVAPKAADVCHRNTFHVDASPR